MISVLQDGMVPGATVNLITLEFIIPIQLIGTKFVITRLTFSHLILLAMTGTTTHLRREYCLNISMAFFGLGIGKALILCC